MRGIAAAVIAVIFMAMFRLIKPMKGDWREITIASFSFAAQELRRVAFARVRQQLDDDVEQLGDAGAGARRDEADRDQVAFAQRLLERRVQLGGVDVALFEVALDEVRRRPRRPARRARGAPARPDEKSAVARRG